MLAARVGDFHMCPMQTPIPFGTIPHVGGPILPPGVPTVLIGGMPAATQTSMCVCVGPPDSIVMGAQNVMISKRMAARMTSTTAHGGTVMSGCPTVILGSGAANIDVGSLVSQAQSAIADVASGVQDAVGDIQSSLSDMQDEMDDLLDDPDTPQWKIDQLQADMDKANDMLDQANDMSANM